MSHPLTPQQRLQSRVPHLNVLPNNNSMSLPVQIVPDYVAMYHAGREDDAYHGLLESGVGMIPELIAAFEATDDTDLRSFILSVVSEYRDLDSSGFLRHALRRAEPLIWKRALDGLVMMGCVADLEHVLVRISDEDKRAWIVEAIEQISVTQHTIEAEQDVPSDGHKLTSSASTAASTAPADAQRTFGNKIRIPINHVYHKGNHSILSEEH